VLENVSTFDLPTNYIERDQQEMMALTLEDVHQTIEQYMNESRMAYVIVGDGETQGARVAKLGYGKPVALNIHGEPLDRTQRASGHSAAGSSQN
jgi:zinc protease